MKWDNLHKVPSIVLGSWGNKKNQNKEHCFDLTSTSKNVILRGWGVFSPKWPLPSQPQVILWMILKRMDWTMKSQNRYGIILAFRTSHGATIKRNPYVLWKMRTRGSLEGLCALVARQKHYLRDRGEIMKPLWCGLFSSSSGPNISIYSLPISSLPNIHAQTE